MAEINAIRIDQVVEKHQPNNVTVSVPSGNIPRAVTNAGRAKDQYKGRPIMVADAVK